AEVLFGGDVVHDGDVVVDCRGLAARDALPDLRGVRGERLIVRSREIALKRPVQLLHPRHPLYIVPWGEGRYMIGATVLETEDDGPVTVRSALELLGAAYAVHPAFAEAEILDLGAGVRPAFPDNVPRAVVREGGRRIFVNGAYRHGFLLGPVLAESVADYLATGATAELIRVES
ncbi:MAG: FAD-dependent oxidoreductase, partial [Gemmatimonadaceae bacterium]